MKPENKIITYGLHARAYKSLFLRYSLRWSLQIKKFKQFFLYKIPVFVWKQDATWLCLQTDSTTLSIVLAAKFLWINRQTSKEEQWKNKLFKQKSMTIWAKNFVELCRQKDLYTYKKVNGKRSFGKNLKLRPWTGWTLFLITIS